MGLWRETEFGKLWAAATFSTVGFHITVLAMQLTAALVLGATPLEMGLLVAAESAPGFLVTLHAGVIVDRVRRRPVMIAADLGRAVLLISIPVAWLGGWLTMAQLYVVAFAVGLLTTFFDVAAPSYLPSLVGRERLLAANGALQSGSAAVNVIGPNLAGVLVQALGAPLAIAADVATYLVSALTLGTIRTREVRPADDRPRRRMLIAAAEGLRHLMRHAVLRPLALTSAAYSFFQGMRAAMIVLFLTGTLGFEPLTLGVLWGVGGIGALLGALAAARLAAIIGTGRALLAAYLIGPFSALAPLAAFAPAVALPIVFIGQFGMGFWGPIYGVNAAVLNQSLVEDRLLGRVLAANRFVYRSPAPLGALAGGLLAGAIGLQAGLLVAAVGITTGALWLYRSPVPAVR